MQGTPTTTEYADGMVAIKITWMNRLVEDEVGNEMSESCLTHYIGSVFRSELLLSCVSGRTSVCMVWRPHTCHSAVYLLLPSLEWSVQSLSVVPCGI